MSSTPRVMISSTFYDLRQVRDDLKCFLRDTLGFEPLLSETNSFPIDPDLDTVENCRRTVEQQADILVLVIGGRYGSVDSRTSKSVTNLEYLAARAKGIPVFVFVQRDLLAALPLWNLNPGANFSPLVEDTRVFEFLRQVRDLDKVWVREFDVAQDIVDSLKVQFARLLVEGLRLTRRLREPTQSDLVANLHGRPARIALERPDGWEHKLLAELLSQEVEKLRPARERLRFGLGEGPFTRVREQDLPEWGVARMTELGTLIESIDSLLKKEMPVAMGELRGEGNLDSIVLLSRSISHLYCEAIEWSLRVKRVAADDAVCSVVEKTQPMSESLLALIEGLGPRLLAEVARIESEISSEAPVTPSVVSLDLEITGLEEFKRAFEEYRGRQAG